MSEKDTPVEGMGQGQLLEEASVWFARMRGPDAHLYQAEFEAWRKRGAVHMAAYNRIAEVFNLGKHLGEEPLEQPSTEDRKSRFPSPALLLTFLATLVLAVFGWSVITPGHPRAILERTANIVANASGRPAMSQGNQYATRLGEIRTFTLSDGSTLILDTDSLVTVAFNDRVRRLRLERGRARFEVFHESRPFVVLAGAGSVIARGTVFDVWLQNAGKVIVHLIHGKVDITADAQVGDGKYRASTLRLKQGEAAAIEPGHSTSLAMASSSIESSDWTDGLVNFDNSKLADVVALANRYGSAKLIIDTPNIANLKVSGAFRISDPLLVATRLAELFDLELDKSVPGELHLKER